MLRGRQAFSAVGSRNLGKRQRRDSHSRRTLPSFALKSIVRSEKTKRHMQEAPIPAVKQAGVLELIEELSTILPK